MTLALEHSFYSGRSLWQLILGGVFERFPGMRFAFVETEADWIAPAIRKLHRRLDWGDDWTGWAKVLPRQRNVSGRAREYWAANAMFGDPHITTEVARKILCENAARVYGFDLGRLQADIDRVGFELVPGALARRR